MADNSMTYGQFHKQRRMFIVVDGTVLVAPKNDPRTHEQWLTETVGETKARVWIASCTRGYVLRDLLVAYVGDSFSEEVNEQSLWSAVRLFQDTQGIKRIGKGVTPSENQPWPPKVLLEHTEPV